MLGCLDNAYERNIVAGHAVKAELQMFHIVRCVMGFQYGIGNGPFSGSRLIRLHTGEGLYFPLSASGTISVPFIR